MNENLRNALIAIIVGLMVFVGIKNDLNALAPILFH